MLDSLEAAEGFFFKDGSLDGLRGKISFFSNYLLNLRFVKHIGPI